MILQAGWPFLNSPGLTYHTFSSTIRTFISFARSLLLPHAHVNGHSRLTRACLLRNDLVFVPSRVCCYLASSTQFIRLDLLPTRPSSSFPPLRFRLQICERWHLPLARLRGRGCISPGQPRSSSTSFRFAACRLSRVRYSAPSSCSPSLPSLSSEALQHVIQSMQPGRRPMLPLVFSPL